MSILLGKCNVLIIRCQREMEHVCTFTTMGITPTPIRRQVMYPRSTPGVSKLSLHFPPPQLPYAGVTFTSTSIYVYVVRHVRQSWQVRTESTSGLRLGCFIPWNKLELLRWGKREKKMKKAVETMEWVGLSCFI